MAFLSVKVSRVVCGTGLSRALRLAVCVWMVCFLGGQRCLAESEIQGLWQKMGIWELSPAPFQELAEPMGFRWNSSSFDAARATGSRLGLTFGGIPVVESLARFREGKLAGFTVSFYTRGDSEELGKPAFETLLKQVVEMITQRSGVRPQVRGKDVHNAVRADGVVWHTPETTWLLEYAITRQVQPQGISYRPEFLRLEMAPPQAKSAASSASSIQDKQELKSHIIKGPEGEVRLEGIPMVDQGQKGYCVVASAERVLRYYGMKTDQHELAQLAGTDRKQGTSLKATVEALKQAGARLHFRVKVVDELDIRELEAFVSDYNRRVMKHGKGLQIAPLRGTIDVAQLFSSMKPEVFRESKMAQKSGMARFVHSVTSAIDAGQPLLWGVDLGIVPEEGLPQKSGGHLRLIIGYNTAKGELLYTDSWGPGHDLKRMSLEDAWLMNSFSLLLTPW
jgi:hypothetical protein